MLIELTRAAGTIPLAPPCETSSDGRVAYRMDCIPPNYRQEPPRGVKATSRCVNAAAFASLSDVYSEPTLGVDGDAAVAQCPSGQQILGCGISMGSGKEMGARYHIVDSGDFSAITANDAKLACVAVSGTGGSRTTAVARCGSLPEEVDRAGNGWNSIDQIAAISLMSKVDFGLEHWRADYAKARCPRPFEIVGCTCFAGAARDCLGERFVTVGASPGRSICALSVTDVPHPVMGAGLAFANCMWRGPKSRVIGIGAAAGSTSAACAAATTAAATQWAKGAGNVTNVMKKGWLPRDLPPTPKRQ